MESTIGDNEKRMATVDDMINWLWHKGNYEGHVGWSAEWNPDGIFGTSHLGPRDMCMSTINIGGDADELQLSSRMGTGVNEGFREVVDREAHEEHVKNMIKKHIKLIPGAVQEIDQRLLKTGVSAEEIASLSSGRATDAYKKLARLDEAAGKCVPSTRVQFRVMSDLLPGEWMAFDIYLPRSCQLEDFECAMLRHGLVMHLNLAALPSDDSSPANVVDSQAASLAGSGSRAFVKKRGCYQKVWSYKIAGRIIDDDDDDDADMKNLEGLYRKQPLKPRRRKRKGLLTSTWRPNSNITRGMVGWTNYTDSGDDVADTAPEGCIPFPSDFNWDDFVDGKVKRLGKVLREFSNLNCRSLGVWQGKGNE
ncbi:hypothetical protein ACO22_06453, partial [Paracoccidioides brasiliensis]